MKKKQLQPSIALLLLAALLLCCAGLLHRQLLSMKRVYGLTQGDPIEEASPLVSFTTIVFGGFRGLLADALWLRASKMQEEGRYVEMVQLAEWITQLEPRFSEVWSFHAWNLAYNISVLFETPEDRWRWVQSGISLLRDEGLVYNPGSAMLYYELAWLYMHKLGSSIDTANQYYKEQLFNQMNQLTSGASRPNYHDPAQQAALAQQRLDAKKMQELEQRYGPLDWRLPQTHAIYWAEQGRKRAKGNEQLKLDRLIYQSLAHLFLRTSLTQGDNAVPPDLALLPYTLAAYDRAIKNYPDNSSIFQARANFLWAALTVCCLYDLNEPAQKIFDTFKKDYPQRLEVDTLEELMKLRLTTRQ